MVHQALFHEQFKLHMNAVKKTRIKKRGYYKETSLRQAGRHSFKGIESATTICKLRGNPYVELVHWLNQLWHQEDNDLKQIIRYLRWMWMPLSVNWLRHLRSYLLGQLAFQIFRIILSWPRNGLGSMPAWSV